jgi:RNA polymerase sigma factor (sigma-70 family)
VQEAFLRFHHQLGAGTKINAPRTWLFRVVQNMALSRHRSERRLIFDALAEETGEGLAQERADSRLNPEELYIRRERLHRLGAGLAELTEQQRFCLHLRAEGLKYREIGVVLGISASSVGELIRRAISRLAGEMDE